MMSSRCISMLALRVPAMTSLASKKSPSLIKLASSRTIATSVARLDSTADMKALGRDYKPDKLDKYILKRYGPKGKYLRTEDIPEQVTRQEMESAKSKFRVEINIYAMIACVCTAAWLIYFARSDQVKHNEEVVQRQKAERESHK